MAEHITKTCPRCRMPLEIKRNHETGEEFLGCTGYRESGCKHTEPLPQHIVLRRQGQKGLFDDLDAEEAPSP
jgi:ssDNA-binding Zn-finger/Zn-ribbon topoisomerase 1